MAVDYSIPGKGTARKTGYVINEYLYDTTGKIIKRPWEDRDSDLDSDIQYLYNYSVMFRGVIDPTSMKPGIDFTVSPGDLFISNAAGLITDSDWVGIHGKAVEENFVLFFKDSEWIFFGGTGGGKDSDSVAGLESIAWKESVKSLAGVPAAGTRSNVDFNQLTITSKTNSMFISQDSDNTWLVVAEPPGKGTKILDAVAYDSDKLWVSTTKAGPSFSGRLKFRDAFEDSEIKILGAISNATVTPAPEDSEVILIVSDSEIDAFAIQISRTIPKDRRTILEYVDATTGERSAIFSEDGVGYRRLNPWEEYTLKDMDSDIQQKIREAQRTVGYPAGSILAFAGGNLPTGFALCDGTLFNRHAYPKLYNLLGSDRLPDLRGQFLRGWNRDSDGFGNHRPLLSHQGDAVGQHTHTYQDSTAYAQNFISGGPSGGFRNNQNITKTTDGNIDSEGETRPENVAVLYGIALYDGAGVTFDSDIITSIMQELFLGPIDSELFSLDSDLRMEIHDRRSDDSDILVIINDQDSEFRRMLDSERRDMRADDSDIYNGYHAVYPKFEIFNRVNWRQSGAGASDKVLINEAGEARMPGVFGNVHWHGWIWEDWQKRVIIYSDSEKFIYNEVHPDNPVVVTKGNTMYRRRELSPRIFSSYDSDDSIQGFGALYSFDYSIYSDSDNGGTLKWFVDSELTLHEQDSEYRETTKWLIEEAWRVIRKLKRLEHQIDSDRHVSMADDSEIILAIRDLDSEIYRRLDSDKHDWLADDSEIRLLITDLDSEIRRLMDSDKHDQLADDSEIRLMIADLDSEIRRLMDSDKHDQLADDSEIRIMIADLDSEIRRLMDSDKHDQLADDSEIRLMISDLDSEVRRMMDSDKHDQQADDSDLFETIMDLLDSDKHDMIARDSDIYNGYTSVVPRYVIGPITTNAITSGLAFEAYVYRNDNTVDRVTRFSGWTYNNWNNRLIIFDSDGTVLYNQPHATEPTSVSDGQIQYDRGADAGVNAEIRNPDSDALLSGFGDLYSFTTTIFEDSDNGGTLQALVETGKNLHERDSDYRETLTWIIEETLQNAQRVTASATGLDSEIHDRIAADSDIFWGNYGVVVLSNLTNQSYPRDLLGGQLNYLTATNTYTIAPSTDTGWIWNPARTEIIIMIGGVVETVFSSPTNVSHFTVGDVTYTRNAVEAGINVGYRVNGAASGNVQFYSFDRREQTGTRLQTIIDSENINLTDYTEETNELIQFLINHIQDQDSDLNDDLDSETHARMAFDSDLLVDLDSDFHDLLADDSDIRRMIDSDKHDQLADDSEIRIMIADLDSEIRRMMDSDKHDQQADDSDLYTLINEHLDSERHETLAWDSDIYNGYRSVKPRFVTGPTLVPARTTGLAFEAYVYRPDDSVDRVTSFGGWTYNNFNNRLIIFANDGTILYNQPHATEPLRVSAGQLLYERGTDVGVNAQLRHPDSDDIISGFGDLYSYFVTSFEDSDDGGTLIALGDSDLTLHQRDSDYYETTSWLIREAGRVINVLKHEERSRDSDRHTSMSDDSDILLLFNDLDSEIARMLDSEIHDRRSADSDLDARLDLIEFNQDLDYVRYDSDSDIEVRGIWFTNRDSEGYLTWNDDDVTLDLTINSEVTLQVGQEIITFARNETDSDIPNGTVVRIDGTTGSHLQIRRASNDSERSSSSSFGVTTQDIGANNGGFVTFEGKVRGLDTSGFAPGAALYLGENGQMIDSEVLSPKHLVFVGWVVRSHAHDGIVYVRINNGWELEELHDVLIDKEEEGKRHGQFLTYDSDMVVWTNTTIDVDYGTF